MQIYLPIAELSAFYINVLLTALGEEFAYYGFTDGVGWLRPGNHFVYEHTLNRFYEKAIKDSSAEEKIIKEGKAYLQTLFQEYLDY